MFCHFSGSKGNMIEASLHPPHLIDSQETLTPAALIPFCAYQMNLLGQKKKYLPPFTVCSQFKPTVLEGQLCYSLDVSSLNPPISKVGYNYGLLLVLDQATYAGKENSRQLRNLNDIVCLEMKPQNASKYSTRIYLNNLVSFTDYRKGSYMMNALKKMTGTKEFLNLADSKKDCSMETFEDCQTRYYFEKVLSTCGCVPWALSNKTEIQAKLMLIF